jgi:hypothetical protein
MAIAVLSLPALAGIQQAAAQDKQPDLDDFARFREIKGGTRALQDASGAETDKNKAAIRKVARWRVARLRDAARTSLGSSDTLSISTAVRDFSGEVLEPGLYSVRVKPGQVDFIQVFGKEALEALKPIFSLKEPYTADKTLEMVNAGRCLAALAKSGYEPVGEAAIAIIDNPAIGDAIKLYYLQALKHLFAASNLEAPEKSVFTDRQREAKVIKSLIAFVTRKPTISPNAPQDEIDGYRYVRREAVRALGMVRHPIVRIEGKIEAVPAVVLLRFAAADKSIQPPPSLSERAEGLVGYLQLNPDKEQNMDLAAGYAAQTILELGVEYKAAKPLPPRGTDPKELPKEPFGERDYLPWKLIGTRISVGLKSWKENWENNLAPPRPPDQVRLVTAAVDKCESALLKFMADGKRDQADTDSIKEWLRVEKFPNNLLFSEDKSTFIER